MIKRQLRSEDFHGSYRLVKNEKGSRIVFKIGEIP